MSLKVCLDDFENEAATKIQKTALDYYRSGCGEQFTLDLNRNAFKRLRILPRCLRNVSNIDTSCNIFGQYIKWPVGIAPSAMQKMAHESGEAANARAAGDLGSIFILSTLSTTSIEQVAKAAPNTCKWFQLYVYKNRALTEELIRRAEAANFKVIVLTIDSPVFGQRLPDIRNNFKLPSHLHLANFDYNTMAATGVHGKLHTSGINEYVTEQFDNSLTWKDVEWLINYTHLPVVVKGILTVEDAILAREIGCAGIIISNHGARQLDYVPASIEVLPKIAKAVGTNMKIMLDGGIRYGTDIFKALALGAKMVFIGRPALWALACNGEAGVKDMLTILKKDFELTLALTGCPSLKDIQPSMITHEMEYAKL